MNYIINNQYFTIAATTHQAPDIQIVAKFNKPL